MLEIGEMFGELTVIQEAAKKEQANNRRTSRFITFGELTDTVSRWCEALQIPEYVVRWRLNKGWEVFDALVKPIKGANK